MRWAYHPSPLLKPLLLGLAARVPGLNHRVVNRGTGGTDRAEYCYGVWLKHLTLLRQQGFAGVPATVGELGPGDSLGVGLAALLSGAVTYFALDVKTFATQQGNEAVLEELIELFARRAPRPTRGWPDFDPLLDERLFPSHVLSEELLQRTLAPPRLAALRQALREGRSADGALTITYKVPWNRIEDPGRGSLDLLVSHSVLEHVDDIGEAYRAGAAWLRPGGWMSHQIDFGSHGLAPRWNGCWAYSSEFWWQLIAARRDCRINRRPASAHLAELRANGLEPALALRHVRTDGIERARLAPAWRHLSDEDLTTAGLFLQARKPAT